MGGWTEADFYGASAEFVQEAMAMMAESAEATTRNLNGSNGASGHTGRAPGPPVLDADARARLVAARARGG